MNVTLDHTQNEAANIRTFFFQPEHEMQYTAGQFIELTLHHKNADDRGEKRWFTLSSSPTDKFLTITTKYAGDDKSSTFKKALFSLEPGAELIMSDPMGDFVLPKLAQTPLLFVAGGIGLTPFHSIFEWLAATGEKRNIRFIYGVRNEDEIIFQDTFERAGVHATIVVSDPSEAWGGERGSLSADLIMKLGEPTEDTLVYVSGPEPMVEALEKDLKNGRIREDQFVGDYFPNYKPEY
ncbi:MAG TPA: FAD-dependent oxidoreductase [Candidatus Saccharimonadales bacterium]|nr:FAD-dependent oxidoreductase [Candidatus Saccharimonadales bacterium]